ncbi:MAG: hypothetical protein QXV69_07310 [Sulfolobaceae archaeon]
MKYARMLVPLVLILSGIGILTSYVQQHSVVSLILLAYYLVIIIAISVGYAIYRLKRYMAKDKG